MWNAFGTPNSEFQKVYETYIHFASIFGVKEFRSLKNRSVFGISFIPFSEFRNVYETYDHFASIFRVMELQKPSSCTREIEALRFFFLVPFSQQTRPRPHTLN